MTLYEMAKQRPAKISVEQAAEIMNVTPQFIRMGLRHGKLPFGVGIKMDKRWSYYINTERFLAYMTARDMEGAV